jgi:hypothetical protein
MDRGCRKLLSEELNIFQSLHNNVRVIKGIRWAVRVALLGEEKNPCKIVTEKPERRNPLNVNNMKIYLK